MTIDFEANAREYADSFAAMDVAVTRWRERIALRERQLERLRAYRVPYVSWIEMLVEPIRSALAETYPHLRFETFGPFGLTAEVSIYASPQDTDPREFYVAGSITFRPTNLTTGAIAIVDRTHEVRHYERGTIGEVNRMQYGNRPLPATFADLCAEFEASMVAEAQAQAALGAAEAVDA